MVSRQDFETNNPPTETSIYAVPGFGGVAAPNYVNQIPTPDDGSLDILMFSNDLETAPAESFRVEVWDGVAGSAAFKVTTDQVHIVIDGMTRKYFYRLPPGSLTEGAYRLKMYDADGKFVLFKRILCRARTD